MFDSQEKNKYREEFDSWQREQTPQRLGSLVRTLSPVIDRGVRDYSHGDQSPVLRSRAKALTVKAIRTYDPNQGASLETHVTNHLKRLQRVARGYQHAIHVPERAFLDQAYLHRATNELTDQLGRAPSTTELADYSNFSPAKIARLRRYRPGVPEGSLPENHGSLEPLQQNFDRNRKVVELLYSELAPRDQQILELSLGLFGNQALDNRAVASQLGVSPGAVSQRKAMIQKRWDQLMSDLTT